MQQRTTTAFEFELAPAALLTVVDAVTRFLEQRRDAVSKNTMSAYTNRLTTWLRWRARTGYPDALAAVTIEELRAFIHYLTIEHVPHWDNPRNRPADRQGAAPATVDNAYRVLSAFWHFLDGDGFLSDSQARFFQNKRILHPHVPQTVRPSYGTHHLEQFLVACKHGRIEETRLRNRAILLVLYETGMRITELCELGDKDVDLIERTANVHGKGDKYRYVFWGTRAAVALDRYLAVRSGESGGPLFRGVGSKCKTPDAPMTGDSVRDMVERLARRAGIDLPDGAPVHAFRHAFARRALDQGMESLHLQQILGHSSSRTTERYVRENPGPLRRIYRRVFDEQGDL